MYLCLNKIYFISRNFKNDLYDELECTLGLDPSRKQRQLLEDLFRPE